MNCADAGRPGSIDQAQATGHPCIVHTLEACCDNAFLPDFRRTIPRGCSPAIIDLDVEGADMALDVASMLSGKKADPLLSSDPLAGASPIQCCTLRADAADASGDPSCQQLEGYSRASSLAPTEDALELFRILDRQLQSSDSLAGNFAVMDVSH